MNVQQEAILKSLKNVAMRARQFERLIELGEPKEYAPSYVEEAEALLQDVQLVYKSACKHYGAQKPNATI